MKIFLYIDESGSIHVNSKTRYFAVGGYFVLEKDKNKVISSYKQINLQIKRDRNIDLKKELKSFDFLDDEKIKIIEEIQKIDSFIGCVKIFDKEKLPRQIYDCNIFYSYAVQKLISNVILPYIKSNYGNLEFKVIISADNRNVGITNIKDLEKYLKTYFCLHDYNFDVTYYNSATNYGIQVADLIVNTFYNKYKDINIVKRVIDSIKNDKFLIE